MNLRPVLITAVTAGGLTLTAAAQTQSLAFTGGVLLNTKVNFHNLGMLDASRTGPATGSAFNRTYDDGFNRVDDSGNKEGETANWGYRDAGQIRNDHIVMSVSGGAPGLSFEDTGNDIEPVGNLEYRGSLGTVGSSDWGVVLGVGYQTCTGKASGTFITDAQILQDRFDLNGETAADLPPPPYAGDASLKGPRIGSTPTRTFQTLPGARLLNGSWKLEAELIPITGGVYFETQVFRRLNAVAAAGVLVLLVNGHLSFTEQSSISGGPVTTSSESEGSNEVVFGGFAEVGLDWALWEQASLVIGGRWQPAETFNQSLNGREGEIDFSGAFALHAGFSMRF